MKANADVNDTLRARGADAVRARHDKARKFNGGPATEANEVDRFKLTAFENIKMSTAPIYLVKGMIPRGALVVIWGPPKCGKSFFALDLFLHIALGREYRARRVRQGAVVYLALEGGGGFADRVEAWRRRHLGEGDFKVGDKVEVEINGALVFARPVKIREVYEHEGQRLANVEGSNAAVPVASLTRARVPFYLLTVPVDIIADHAALIEAIKFQGVTTPDVVVIDTLNRGLVGDENKSDDMARFIRAADAIRQAFGCAVIVIHHCGVAGNRPRGHTSLTGAVDAQIAVERNDEGIITVKVEHMKDGEPAAPMSLKLERVELVLDDDGDLKTSCVVVPAGDGAAADGAAPKLSKANQFALTLLQRLIDSKGEAPPPELELSATTRVIHAETWRDRFIEAYPAGKTDNPDSRKRAHRRAVGDLLTAGFIDACNEWVWLPDKTDKSKN